MTQPPARSFQPDYAIPPGETLRATIGAVDMSQAELARRTGLSTKHINQVIQGVAPITPDTALALERVLAVPARFWNALEANHQAREVRLRDQAATLDDHEWIDRLPTKELMRRGVIERTADAAELRDRLLAFFGVASRQSWEAVWLAPDAAFRRSAVFAADPFATAAWLRLGEIEAAGSLAATYNRPAFEQAIASIRGSMGESPDVFEPLMKRLCADAGVVVSIVAEVKGSRVNGATRWLSPTRALIQLSVRYRWEDVFWFTFFHEAGHVLLHGKRDAFVDDGRTQSNEEEEANTFAQTRLIPSQHEAEFLRIRTVVAAKALARKVGVPPGIVIGRAQREGLIAYNVGNSERRRFKLTDE
jgi:HTH-type transcriptional regulator/antitoxin HigA